MVVVLDPATGGAVPELEQETRDLLQLCQQHKIAVVGGHGAPDTLWQDAKALLEQNKATYKPVPRELMVKISADSSRLRPCKKRSL